MDLTKGEGSREEMRVLTSYYEDALFDNDQFLHLAKCFQILSFQTKINVHQNFRGVVVDLRENSRLHICLVSGDLISAGCEISSKANGEGDEAKSTKLPCNLTNIKHSFVMDTILEKMPQHNLTPQNQT